MSQAPLSWSYLAAPAFAVTAHLALNHLFGIPAGGLWLLGVLAAQGLVFALAAAGRASGPFALAGAASVSLTVGLFLTARAAVQAGVEVIGAAAALLGAFISVFCSHRLAVAPEEAPRQASSRPPSQRVQVAHPRPASVSSRPAAPASPKVSLAPPDRAEEPPPDAAAPAVPPETVTPPPAPVSAGPPAPSAVPSGPRPAVRFRVLRSGTEQLLAAFPCAEVDGALDLEALRAALPEFDPRSICVMKVSWATDDAVDVHVDGRPRSEGSYRLLETPEE